LHFINADPDISGSYYAMQRAGQAAIDLAIQTNTAIVVEQVEKLFVFPPQNWLSNAKPKPPL